MKDNQAKYPQLRFKGFTDPWEQRRLGERFSERADRSGDGKMLSVTIANGVVLANSLDRKDNSSSDKSNYKVVKKDDIAYNSMRMWQAASGVSKYDGIVSPAYTVLVPANGESSTFFGYQFKQTEMKQIFQRNSQGLTSDTWNLKYPLLSRIKTSAPEKTEQIKIGEFLNKLDNLIAVNQRKLAKLKELKQGYLQKMFPKNGSKFPQLRFAGFADAWEQRKFGELYKKNLERNKDHFSSDRTISIATMRFKKEGNGAAENSLVSYKVLREGDIAFEGHTSKRFAFGRFVLNDIGDGIMSPRFTTLRPTQDMPIKFWKQYIHYEPIMRYPIVNSTKLGTMMNELVVDEFLNQPVLVPELSEQQKIGSFFKQLDNTITLHQRKLEKLQELKKGYLQKMFC
ncbi:restriction endonuclease subunit S [Pediococcus acidilactici]|uniref:restriction endonuclease subunit S n=1 Tax=Pediococcus acidilactici TaxID=1254 RepID=UPI001326C1E7|nr:restriction endonuclease subunit S [Pediococcus acidilactici]KAF0383117.1 restriction endonuclease subunit S [Pediococcus acidilactici]KAF0428715.1 restriction endonuclease subunit S [Pediococcus acidilactici]